MADVAQVLADAPAPAALPAGPEERKRRSKIAEALAMQAADYSPVQHWTQGAARVANGLVGSLEEYKLDRDERSSADRLNKLLLANPALGGSGSIAPAAAPTGQSADASVPFPGAGAGGSNSAAISGIESGGRYDALGPVIEKTGDRAFGKYQVMGANIPEWTRTHYGRELTPQEFLKSPEAQEAVFKGQFDNTYVPKYGREGAARAWFAGEGNMNNLTAKDPLGTTVGGYAKKFAALAPTTAIPGATAAPAPADTPAPAAGSPAPAAGPAPGSPTEVAQTFQPATPSAAAPAVAAAAPGAPGALPANDVTGGPLGAGARMQTQMDPQMQAYVKLLLASRDPNAAAIAQQIIAQYSKPSELKYQVVGDTIVGLDPATGALRAKYQVNSPDLQKLDDGRLYDKRTGAIINVVPGTRSLTDPAERTKYGIAAGDTRTYQIDSSGKLSPVSEPQRPDFEHSPDGHILNKHTGEYVTPAQAGFGRSSIRPSAPASAFRRPTIGPIRSTPRAS
jgi:hypothetical protein